MNTINIPPTFSELEQLKDEDLRKLVRMATAILNERGPVLPPSTRSSNIENAFQSIPSTPVDAEEFAARHNISVTTLRQQKRFDPLQGEGVDKVHVKKSRKDGHLYVWRGAGRLIDEV